MSAGAKMSNVEASVPEATTAGRNSTSTSFINYHYFKSIPGILKFVELIFGIICITTGSPPVIPGTYFFIGVCYFCMIFTGVWIFIIFFRIESKIAVNPSWPAMELFYNGLAFYLYSLGTTAQFASFDYIRHVSKPRSIAAAVFGLFNILAYGISVVFVFKEWRYAVYITRDNRVQSPTV